MRRLIASRIDRNSLCSKACDVRVNEIYTNPYQASTIIKAPKLWNTRNLVVAAILAIVLVIVLLPLGYVSVFDGHYDLSVTVQPTDQIAPSSLLFATCWTKQNAQSAIDDGTNGSASFDAGSTSAPNTHVVSVPYSGRSNSFGRITSYNQPKYLVVQYDLTKPAGKTVRKQVPIPQGRGNRSITVTVP